jgi:hypothetical protein
LVVYEEQNTVRVTVRQIRDGTVSVLIQRIVWTTLVTKFRRIRHNLPPDGISRLLNEAEVICVDPDSEILADLLSHFLINTKPLEQLFGVVDAVSKQSLPFFHCRVLFRVCFSRVSRRRRFSGRKSQ